MRAIRNSNLFLSFIFSASLALAIGAEKDPALSVPSIGLSADSDRYPLVPWPMRGTVGKENIRLKPTARIMIGSPELRPLGELLANEIARLTQQTLPVAEGRATPDDIQLRLNPKLSFPNDPYLRIDPALANLNQRIVVSRKGILAEGSNYQSTAMASVTLLQALRTTEGALSLPVMYIEDKPGSVYCGVMLDVARQWHPIEKLREVVDLCRLYKVPFLHLHLTDDQGYRLPSEAFPSIPTPGASYSMKEMRDFVAYADARGVTVVPEIELPGHSSALQNAMPEIFGAKNAAGEFEALGVINIANEEIYPVLEKLIAETCDIFKSSPYFHIGADETIFGPFLANPHVQQQLAELEKEGVKSNQIFAHFINRIDEIVKKNGKKTICWEGFGPDQPVNKDVIIIAWHGSSHAPQDLLAAGYKIINVPWTPAVSWSVKQNYEWNKWLLNLNEQSQSRQFEANPNIIGGQMVLWEQGPESAISMLREKVPARQERLYSPWAQRSFEDYAKRASHTDRMLEKLLYPVEVSLGGLTNTVENLFEKNPVTVSLSCPVKGANIYYTIGAGKEPDPETGTLYSKPFEISSAQAGEVYVAGYYGPRVELRVRAFDPEGQPLGGAKWIELRSEAPRISYQVYHLPADTETMPDFKKLKPISNGKLARFESTRKLASTSGEALALVATGKFDARSEGEYRMVCSGENVRLRIDGKEVTIGKDHVASVNLSVGIHDITVEQFSGQGNIGAVLTMEKFVPDPAPNSRKFTNEYLHQWMTPLAD